MISSFIEGISLWTRRLRPYVNNNPVVSMTNPISSPTLSAINKADFDLNWSVYALTVPPKLCNNVRTALKGHTLHIPRVPSVEKSQSLFGGDACNSVFLLLKYFAVDPQPLKGGAPVGNADFSFTGKHREDVATYVRSLQLSKKVDKGACDFIRGFHENDLTVRDVAITFEHWSADAVLRALLPSDVTVPSSFETIGHIAHLNLRDEQLPYKGLIGQTLVDKLGPRIRTVVNKVQNLGGPYRTFEMEVLAGDDNLETTVKENGCKFVLDFSKVYWNSRLETEHRRIIDSLKPGDILADAFAGIGPFTIPAAKQERCTVVYANDLNPSSIKYLQKNVAINNLKEGSLVATCGCARDFLKKLVRVDNVPITKVVMNFPSGAPEFLDVFRELYKGLEERRLPMPTIHCYCFVKNEAGAEEVRHRIKRALFGENDVARQDRDSRVLSDECISIREVRDVAPRKRQVCVTFSLPESVAYGQDACNYSNVETECSVERERKRTKTMATA